MDPSQMPPPDQAPEGEAPQEAVPGSAAGEAPMEGAAMPPGSQPGEAAAGEMAPDMGAGMAEVPMDQPPPEMQKKSRHRPSRGKMDLTNARIGFIGAGRICDAIIEGLTGFGNIKPEQIYVASPGSKKKAKLENYKSSKMNVSKRPFDIFAKCACDIIFLCFHGNVIKDCLRDPDNPRAFLTNFIPRQKNKMYVLSLVSGCSVDQIKASLLNPEYPEKYQIKFHRIMINVACAYGLGLCAVDTDPDSKLSEIVRSLLSRIAKLEHVVGDQIDAACATAGYGLAFSYHFIDALAMAATKIGLDRAMAIKFAAKTAQASGQTLIESGLPPDQMKDVLIAPGGAAIEGIHALEKTEFNSAISTAIEATYAKLQVLAGGAA